MIVDLTAAVGELVWLPDEDVAESSAVAEFARQLHAEARINQPTYDALWRWSVDHPDDFWPALLRFADLTLGGEAGPTKVGKTMQTTRWFPGRTLNASRRFLDGHEGAALIRLSEDGERREMSFAQVRESVAALAAQLRGWGVKSGDRVVAVLPNVEEAAIAFLAVASIGGVWSICAPEFGSGAIISRFAQLDPVVIIAAPGYRLGGRDRDRGPDLEQVIEALPTLTRVVWVTAHTDAPIPGVSPEVIDWAVATATPAELVFEDVEFNHPLWVLFSSGTTGRPKGIVHSHGGALLELVKLHLFHTDLKPGDRYLNVASTSWVLWNSLIAALTVGATAVLVDGSPTYPSVARVWDIAAQERVASMGVGAGFVHACQKNGLLPARDYDLSALRSLQVTGSPLSPDGHRWIYEAVGDIWVNSMSGGTDIGSIFVGGAATLPVYLGLIQAPALGVDVQAWDELGRQVRSQRGELVVCGPLPSMPLEFWGDDDGSRYSAAYFEMFPGVWRHGDFIEIRDEGIIIHGRSDSTLNRHGLRLGSADIYSAVESVPGVRESLVVGAELGVDYYMPLFLALETGAVEAAVRAKVDAAIRSQLSARYLPDEIIVMGGIPHTRTGKKLEVPIKRLLQGAELNDVVDIDAVDDPALLNTYADFAKRRNELQQGAHA